MFLKKWEDLILMAGKSKVLPNNHDARETNFSAIATTLRDTQQLISVRFAHPDHIELNFSGMVGTSDISERYKKFLPLRGGQNSAL